MQIDPIVCVPVRPETRVLASSLQVSVVIAAMRSEQVSMEAPVKMDSSSPQVGPAGQLKQEA